MIKISKIQLLLGAFLFCIIGNILIRQANPSLVLLSLIWLPNLLLIPGSLILNAYTSHKKISKWSFLVYAVGISLTLLMFSGLITNIVLDLKNVLKPLSSNYLVNTYNIVFGLSWLLALIRKSDFSFNLDFRKIKLIDGGIVFISILALIALLIMVVLGVNNLNNNQGNLLTLITLCGVGIFLFLSSIVRPQLLEKFYPAFIMLISLILLFDYSLRSLHIIGFDINEEFRVFELTKNRLYWNYANLRSAYNACLSITLLPTILSSFLKISDEYIFKLIYPIIFSLIPVVVYQINQRFVSKQWAYLSSIFFFTQAQFIYQLTAINRQGVALFFFSLMILILFESQLKTIHKNLLFLLFGFAMVVSHYSTTYVALAILFSSYFIITTLGNFIPRFKKIKVNTKLLSLLLLLAFSFFWNSIVTDTSSVLSTVIGNSIKNLDKIADRSFHSVFVKNIFFVQEDTSKNLRDFYGTVYSQITPTDKNGYYKRQTYDNYQITLVGGDTYNLTTINYPWLILFHKIIPWLIRLSILIGIVSLLLSLKRSKKSVEFTIYTLVSVLIVGFILIVPYISISYNFERLFQQNLVFLSLPAVIGFSVIFKNKLLNKFTIFIVIVFIANYLQTSGVVDYLLFKKTNVSLSNTGEEYDRYYTQETEVASLKWLGKNYTPTEYIYIDRYANLKAISQTDIKPERLLGKVIPPNITIGSYVYSSYSNTVKQKVFVEFNNNVITYNYPTEFLEANKNTIYSNGQTQIYK